MDADSIYTLTFDCYGTLIDWEGGVRAACAGLASLDGLDLDRVVRDRGAFDRQLIQEDYRPYGEVLARSLASAAAEQGRHLDSEDGARFADSMRSWPPFSETPAALRRLAERFQLAILSNVENETLRASIARLGAPIEVTVTAEDLRSYKPRPAHFHEALRRIGQPAERVLHVACSLFHDVRPAKALGWRCAWVRRDEEPIPPRDEVAPDLVVPTLDALADALLA